MNHKTPYDLSNKFFTIQGWMLSNLKLKGIDLLVYAIIYGFSQDENSKFMGTLSYLEQWTGSNRSTIMRSLKNLISKNLILKEEQKANGLLKRVFYRASLCTEWQNATGGKMPPPRGKMPLNNINNNIKSFYPITKVMDKKEQNLKNGVESFQKNEKHKPDGTLPGFDAPAANFKSPWAIAYTLVENYDCSDKLRNLLHSYLDSLKVLKINMTPLLMKMQLDELDKLSDDEQKTKAVNIVLSRGWRFLSYGVSNIEKENTYPGQIKTGIRVAKRKRVYEN